MKHLVVDIETILDPMFPPPESALEKRSLLAPPYWQVVTIGCLLLDTRPIATTGERYYIIERLGAVGPAGANSCRTQEQVSSQGLGERDRLEGFVNYLKAGAVTLVTFNGRGFDLPVIAARCFHHAIPFRFYYQERDVRYRYSADGHFDLMDFLADYGASKSASLDVWSKLCGMPGKVGVDGSQVEGMIAEGRQKDVDDYCLCDVVQTAAVFFRTELLRGKLTTAGYEESFNGLKKLIQTDERLKALDKAICSKEVEK